MLLNRDQQLADALYEQDYEPKNVHGGNSNYAYGMPSQMSIRPHGLASQAKQQNLANSLKRSYWEGWVKPNSTAGNTTSTAGPLPSDTAAAAAAAATIGQSGQNHIGLGYPSDSNGKRIRPAYGGPPYPKKKKTGGPKILNANSMTPAALVHQLFNGIQESYEHNPRNKTYRCTLVVLNQQFEMDASSKKEAKQKAAELAVRTLRPDIPLSTGSAIVKPIGVVNPASVGGTPIVASSSKLPVAKGVAVVSGSGSNPTPISAYGSTSGVVCTRNTDQMESIVDYMFQLIANKFNGLHNPSYDVVETTSRELGPSEAHKKTYKCTLTFPEEGKTFVNIGYGKEAQKEICARKALTSLLGVPKDEVHKIIKGIALTKLRPDGTYISALHQIAATFRCELEVKVHHAEPTYEQKVEMLRKNIPAQTPAVAVYKITDYAEEGKMTKFTSRSYSTQQEAKEAAAAEALKKYFRVDMANLEKEKLEYQKMKKALQLHTPSQLLNERIQQRRALALNEKEKNMEATYEEIGIDPRTGHHKMKVSIDGQSFIGSGESRKIAKNQAALFAMRTLFKMEEVPKGPQKLSIPQSQLPCSKLCFEINEFSKIEYLNMCQYYGIKPSSWFSVFLLVNEKNEKRVLSMAGSNGAVLQGNQFLSSQGSSLLHIDSIVLARRSLVRNLMLELELAQKDSNKSILEMGEDALYRLKSNLKLVLYSSHAPDCSYSCEESPDKKLSYISFGGYSPAVETPQTMKEIKENDFIRVHSTSDKIFKWTHLGVQGALLSALMHPILPEIVIFGMRAPIDDCSLGYALYSRLSDDRYPFMLESANDYFEPSSTQPHVFTRGFDGIEMIYPNTGRSTSGAPSRLCKLEMFENFLKVAPHISRSSSYLEAKSHALIYNEAKKVFYETLKLYNWGNWQKKSQQAIDFHLMSADEL